MSRNVHKTMSRPLALAALLSLLAIPAVQAASAIAAQNAVSPDEIAIISRLPAKPGHERELAARLAATVSASKQEPGVVAADLYRSREERGVFYLHEVYRNTSALNYHFAQGYTGALIREINRSVRTSDAKIEVLGSVEPT
jgi:quinol monooxygenase YgiN